MGIGTLNIKRLAATATLAVAAVGITAATANAQPAALADQSVRGSAAGIDYTTTVSNSARAVTTTLDAGTFVADGAAVRVLDAAGATVAQVPTTFVFAGQKFETSAQVDASGRSLTLRPKVETKPVALEHVGAQQWFMNELQRSSTGALVGALIGGAIGILFLGVGLIPGAIIGAVIGALAAGGQPLIDSGFAYFSGQP